MTTVGRTKCFSSLRDKKDQQLHGDMKGKGETNRKIFRFGKDFIEGVDIFQIECLAVQMEHNLSFQICKPPISTFPPEIMVVIKRSHESA